MRYPHLWTFILLLLLLAGTAQAEIAIPNLTQRVTDLTATLDAQQIQTLDASLAEFETRKGAQLAVLMVPTTQPESIEQFSIRVVEKWKLGRKGVDDGVLLLIAKEDRKLRIEVGYGLEGALNDATAKRIVAEIITPYFKRGELYAGIDAGMTAIIGVIEGEALPPPAADPTSSVVSSSDDWGDLFGISFFIVIFANVLLRQWLGRLLSGLLVGGIIGALAGIMLLSLSWGLLAALFAFLFSLILGTNIGDSFFSAVCGGGGWRSGSSSGSFGGGGGGGSFGGGGSSGSW